MVDIFYSLFYEGMTGVISLIIGLVLLFIRFRARDSPMTRSQGWGLVLLAWLFLCNAFLNIEGAYSRITWSSLSYWAQLDLPVIAPAFLIAFGLIFPQPVVRPSRVPLLFLFISGVLGLIILMTLGGHSISPVISGWGDIQNIWMFTGWTIPVLRWTMLYRKNRAHPEISLISTLLIWGVLYHSFNGIVTNGFFKESADDYLKEIVFLSNIFQLLMIVIIGLIIHQLYERRASWGLAEKVHLFMLCLLVAGACCAIAIRDMEDSSAKTLLSLPLRYLMLEAGILFIRPALIIYAILAFQFFGPELKAEVPVVFLAGLELAYFGGVLASFWFYDMGGEGMGKAGFVVFFALLVPALFLAKRIVYRLVPTSRKMSRKEIRDLYFVSMFTALFKGAIEDREDAKSLTTLRERLGITDREHSLIIESERARVREESVVNKIRYALLVRDSGILVASYGPMGDQDEMVIASMLTAVRSFVKDTFGGPTGDLDTIQYGDKKMLLEWERGYILALDMEGEYDPTSRVLVGDMLALLIRRHWWILNDWDGNQDDVRSVQEHLTSLVISYNKTGVL